MPRAANVGKITADEFLDWEAKQSSKHEFIGGEVFAMVGVTRQHATVAGNVFALLMQHLRGTRCRVYISDMKLRLEESDAFFYPDVFVTCSETDHRAEHYMREPRLIVEVLSESTEAYDRGDKFEQYRRFPSLVEYVLINPAKRRAEVFRADAGGHWVLHDYRSGEPIEFASLGLLVESSALYENLD